MAKTPNPINQRVTKSSRRQASRALAPAADDGGTTFSFGIVFDIKGTPVPISAADIGRLKESGLDLKLPNPVVLGSINDLIKWIETTFSTPAFPTDLPGYLGEIVGKILSMVFTVNVFELTIPPQKSGITEEEAAEGTKYALEIAGVFPGAPLQPIPGFPLGIQGGVFGATNKAPAITS